MKVMIKVDINGSKAIVKTVNAMVKAVMVLYFFVKFKDFKVLVKAIKVMVKAIKRIDMLDNVTNEIYCMIPVMKSYCKSNAILS